MKRKHTRAIANNFFMFQYVLKFTPLYFWNILLSEIFFAIEVFLEFTYCKKYILELIQYGGTFLQAAKYLLLISFLVIIKIIWAAVLSYKIVSKSKEHLHKKLQEELYEKAVKLDISRYDNPECYNEFVFSVGEASVRVDEMMKDFGQIVRYTASMIMSGVFFLAIDKMGLLFVFVSVIFTLLANNVSGKLQFEMDKELKPIQRKRNYFSRVFYLSDYAKEIRVNPIFEKLIKDFDETNEAVYPVAKKYGRKQISISVISELIANHFILDVCYLSYLLYYAVVKVAFSYGSMLSLFGASSTMKNSLKNISVLIPKFRQHSFYVEKIREFLEFEAQIKDGDESIKADEFQQLELQDISFGYEKKPILKNVSMNIKKGEKIAIVGYNGAGKTTLIKLIMRLYDVNEGRVIVNGHRIDEYNVKSYRNLFGSVFQDYKLYGASLAENVKMDIVENSDEKSIIEALKQSGLARRISSLEYGLNTGLTREFDNDGTNLSGGETQKVAIARAFYRNAPIIIMDEPSSALDPISESYLNSAMIKGTDNRTLIFISHRLSTTRMADRIYMMEKGNIIEQGCHDELMKLDGKYAKMFRMQSEKYRTGYSSIATEYQG